MLGALGLGVGALVASAPPSEVAHAAGSEIDPLDLPTIALLSGAPGGRQTSLLLLSPGSTLAPPAAVTFDHAADSVVRGAVMPGSATVLAVADLVPTRDRSWAAGLVRLDAGAQPRVLVDQVYHATRPLIVDASHVLVQRGIAGPEPSLKKGPLTLREDALAIDEVDIDTGATRTVHTWTGFETHLAGLLEREAIVYRVGPSGADLVAVHLDTLSVRTIVASWAPMARDFSIDPVGRALVVQQWTDTPARAFTAERVSLDNGSRMVLATSRSADMVPYAWPSGGVLVHPEGARAPQLLAGAATVHVPSDPGVLWVRAQSADGAWVGALRMHPRALPTAWVIRVRDGRSIQIPIPAGMRGDFAGFVGGAP